MSAEGIGLDSQGSVPRHKRIPLELVGVGWAKSPVSQPGLYGLGMDCECHSYRECGCVSGWLACPSGKCPNSYQPARLMCGILRGRDLESSSIEVGDLINLVSRWVSEAGTFCNIRYSSPGQTLGILSRLQRMQHN